MVRIDKCVQCRVTHVTAKWRYVDRQDVFSFTLHVIHSCNTGMWNLPGIYAKSQRTKGIHIRWIPCFLVTSNMYHFQYSKHRPDLQFSALHIYIAMGICCDYEIFIFSFHDVYLCIAFVLVSIVGLRLNICSSYTRKLAFRYKDKWWV